MDASANLISGMFHLSCEIARGLDVSRRCRPQVVAMLICFDEDRTMNQRICGLFQHPVLEDSNDGALFWSGVVRCLLSCVTGPFQTLAEIPKLELLIGKNRQIFQKAMIDFYNIYIYICMYIYIYMYLYIYIHTYIHTYTYIFKMYMIELYNCLNDSKEVWAEHVKRGSHRD